MSTFFIKCIPPKSTAQAASRIFRRKDGTQFIGKTAKGMATRNELMTLLQPHAPREPIAGPVCLRIVWSYPWRKGESRKQRSGGWKACTTRPDVDNICKMVLDCMTRLAYWNDDAQVCSLTIIKRWADEPGIQITIDDGGQQ
jgi:Holliday junction resolvase RusA-like endonuclease